VRRIAASGSSLWPTSTAQDSASSGSAAYGTEIGRHSGTTLTDAAGMWVTPVARDVKGAGASEGMTRKDGKTRLDQLPNQAEHQWPTPRAGDGDKGGPNSRDGSGSPHLCSEAVMWKTPTANEDAAGRPGTQMQQQIKQQAEEWAIGHQDPRATGPGSTPNSGPQRLNPLFVEWLMGLPRGWTAFEPSGMESFRRWSRERSPHWPPNS